MDQWTIETNAKQCRVVLAGDLTASTASQLRPALKKELERGASELIFELGQTSMLDSTGIGLLISTYNSLARTKGSVRVQNVSPDILQLLQSMRLVDRLCVSGRN